MRRIQPALPTLMVCAFLAIDLAGIVNSLYLAIFSYYFWLLAIVVVAFVIFTVKDRSLRSPASVSCLLLGLGILAFPFLLDPVALAIQNHTNLNRSFAVVRTTYKGTNVVEFTITAHGEGSWQNLTLDSGYANISINADYSTGPSLHYQLNPAITIKLRNAYVPIEQSTLLQIYRNIGLDDIATDQNVHEFQAILRTMSEISSKEQFIEAFRDVDHSEIDLMPDDNAVARVCFLLVSLGAILISIVLTKQCGSSEVGVAGSRRD